MQSPKAREYYGFSDFFNYGYWRAATRTQHEASENLVEALLGFIPARRGTILDVACGLGATTKHLLKYYDRSAVVGINVSEVQLAISRRNVPGGLFAAMDAAQLAFLDGYFDAVICVEAAFHFVTREDFLREAFRVLKPGGTLVLSDIIFGRVPRPHNRRRWVPENLVTNIDQYRSALLGSGFSDVQITDATSQCWKAFKRNLLRWGYRKLRASELPPTVFARAFLSYGLVDLFLKHYLLVAATKG
jgi:SAM-dependent methyltransferase